MVDSVAPVIRRGVLAALLGLLLAAPAEAKTSTHTWRVGPVDMRGYATEQALQGTRAPKIDGYLTAMHARIVDAAGNPVPQERVMLHHVFFVNHGRFRGDRRAGDCRRRNGETFYGTGEEDQAIELPAGYGYRLRKRDRWRVGWMFMNHRHVRERVYLQYTVTVTDEPRTPVTPYWISVSCADGKIYSVPGDGGVHELSRTWTVPRGGRIVAAAAHAHGGAIEVDVADERCGGRRLLVSTARYGLPEDPIYNLSPVLHEPSPRSMSVATSAAGWAVSRGDRLKVTSRYANSSPHSAVMGIMHLYIAHGAGRPEPCPPLPADVQEQRLAYPRRARPHRAAARAARAVGARHRRRRLPGRRPHRPPSPSAQATRPSASATPPSRPAACRCPAARWCAGASATRSSTTSRSPPGRAASPPRTRRAAPTASA